jgi:hypothetical protein
MERNSIFSDCLACICGGFEELRSTLILDDLQCLKAQREYFLEQVRQFSIWPEPDSQVVPYKLDQTTKVMKISEELLTSLSAIKDQEMWKRFGQIFMLHEILHNLEQGIHNGNYKNVGRANVIVSRIDQVADSFSICVSVSWYLRVSGNAVSAVSQLYISTIFKGLYAFDSAPRRKIRHEFKKRRMSEENSDHRQSAQLTKITETRLRRYLTWLLLYQRVALATTLEDLITILRDERLSFQISPLPFRLNFERDCVISLKKILLHETRMATQSDAEGEHHKTREEVPFSIFIVLNEYFYRIDDDEICVLLLKSFFAFDWKMLFEIMQLIHQALPQHN